MASGAPLTRPRGPQGLQRAPEGPRGPQGLQGHLEPGGTCGNPRSWGPAEGPPEAADSLLCSRSALIHGSRPSGAAQGVDGSAAALLAAAHGSEGPSKRQLSRARRRAT
eukprot:6725758-Pyramimonas_sp.AAC.1